MTELKTMQDLDDLSKQINSIRSKCKKEPDTKTTSFLATMLGAFTPLKDECNNYNNKVYEALPQEIPINKDLARLLTSLFIDNAKSLDDLNRSAMYETKKFLAECATTILTGGPLALPFLGAGVINQLLKMDKFDAQLAEIVRRASGTMKEVLGSYQLTMNSEGQHILKKGKWSVYTETISKGGGIAYREHDYHKSAVKDVGISRDLLPEEYRYLLDKNSNPINSPNVGRW